MMWIVVFASVATLDFIWARYTKCVTVGKAAGAGVYAVLIMLLGGLTIIGYTADHWMLIPAAAGAFVGTYGAVRWGGD